MFVVFFFRSVIIETIILEIQHTVTVNWYTQHCFLPHIAMLKDLRPKSQLRIWFLHHDNVVAHWAQATTGFFN